ncbi:hypothetical protein GMOD_00009210 [Pyrenophora seminiperda CCB06]|uniref:Uncharacterized protein n=1 Tax=Pyrenophora seminiperda CCB06 TaxID=1302712 RepID=A0A3M7MBE1_9PLEO|nr:hypothetical protein GMOD_00009210 [Pyrenophora seminiperda CCB06]
MPQDPSGTSHTGTHGLFDDPDELAATTAHATSHELHRLQGQIRRLERHDKSSSRREARREEKRLLRQAHGKGERTAEAQGGGGWFARVFGVRSVRRAQAEERKDSINSGKDGDDGGDKQEEAGRKMVYSIIRRPVTPETVWRKEHVMVGEESLWLRECGMVRVKRGDEGGCHIVSERVIERRERGE